MLPEKFLQRMQAQLGDEYPKYLASLERPRAVALRFNPLKADPIPQLPFTTEPVPWEPAGFYYDPAARPGLHIYHDAGVYYLQEASAMAPVVLLNPKPGEWVCDLCAAPGGKTTQIAGRMAGQGLLLCNEIHPKRARILSQNIERLGIANALVTQETPARLAARFPNCFDRVLVDAPCSGEGMFRKEEAAVTDWSRELVEMCARRQAEILRCAAQMVRPGGRLVYATCTFSEEENEGVIAAFLAEHPAFSPEEPEAPWFCPGSLPGTVRLWPHQLRGEGHFAAVLRKCGEAEPARASLRGVPAPAVWSGFAKELGITLPAGTAVTFGESLYWAPPDTPALAGLRVLRPGLELGTVKKDRLEPAHALALWLRDCRRTLELPPDSAEAAAYLHGEVIPADVRGWCLVTTGGYSLGWGKGDGSRLKNHYPKGLRR